MKDNIFAKLLLYMVTELHILKQYLSSWEIIFNFTVTFSF